MSEKNNFLLGIYFLLQFNPIYFFILTVREGYDVTFFRLSMSIAISGIFILFCLKNTRVIHKRDLVFLGFFFSFIAFHTLFSMPSINGLDIDLSWTGLVFEFALAYIVFSLLNNRDFEGYCIKNINIIFYFCGIHFALWMLSIISGQSWGIFRAYIGGITINRLADFIYPLFFPFIFFKTKNIFLKFFSIMYLLATSYRTIYLAFIIGSIAIILKGKLNFRIIFSAISIVVVSIISIIIIFPDTILFIERLFSLFISEQFVEGEGSKSQRILDLQFLLKDLSRCLPFGCGIKSNSGYPYYVYPFFNIWIVNIYGIFCLPMIFWTFYFFKFIMEGGGYLYSSVFFSLLVLVTIFPYFHFFPLMIYLAFFTHLVIRSGTLK